MVNDLTVEQIKGRFEHDLLPNKARIEINDYETRMTLKVFTEDGLHIYTLPAVPVHELQTRHYLRDVIDGTRREVRAKLRRKIP